MDDHPLYREGLGQFINRQTDLVVCGESSDGVSTLEIIRKKKPHLVTIDFSLNGSHGLNFLKSIKTEAPTVSVLVISRHDELLYAERALRVGAQGYIMKNQTSEKIMSAIRRVLQGQIYLSEAMTDRLLSQQVRGATNGGSSVDFLSNRELEVFQSIGQGQSTQKIAEKLHLSIKTVETYRAHIKTKLNLPDNTTLIKHAVEWTDSAEGM